jgi:hypothetical protein
MTEEPHPEPLLVTVKDLVATLRCSEPTIYRLFARGFAGGGLDALKFGKRTLTHRWQLQHLIDNFPRGVASESGVTGAKMAAATARRVEAGLPPLRTGRPSKAVAA